jgi:hypothetical protein
MAAQAQLQQMRGRPGLPPGMPAPGDDNAAARPGTYL